MILYALCVVFLHLTVRLEAYTCGFQGRCSLESFMLGASHSSNQTECLWKCKSQSFCTWFSFDEWDRKCELFLDCLSIEPMETLWITGEETCDEESVLACNYDGFCLGPQVSEFPCDRYDICLEACKSNDLCLWFTLNSDVNTCYLNDNCDYYSNNSCVDCSLGQKQCPLSHLTTPLGPSTSLLTPTTSVTKSTESFTSTLTSSSSTFISSTTTSSDSVVSSTATPKTMKIVIVATGSNGTYMNDVEILDIENSSINCMKPRPTDAGIKDAIGLSYLDNPVICGGRNSSGVKADCILYESTEDKWVTQQFALSIAREQAVSVQISPGRYLILGGHTCDPCQTLKSTELFEDGNFTPGPDLPEPMNRFSAAMFNDTHLFVASGNNGHGYSGRNFLLNILDWNWIELESRLDPYMGHSSGSFYNAEKGKNEIVITDRDSSHIFDVENNSLRKGPELPHYSTYASTVQYEDFFYLVGGSGCALSTYCNSIFKFSSAQKWEFQASSLDFRREKAVVAEYTNVVNCNFTNA